MTPIDSEANLTPSQQARLRGIAKFCERIRGRNGRPVNVCTLRKWCDPRRGYRSRSGVIVILRTVRVSGNLLCLEEWVEDFERARVRAGAREPLLQERTRRESTTSQKRARDWLNEHGIK